jgi:hypothetical protein
MRDLPAIDDKAICGVKPLSVEVEKKDKDYPAVYFTVCERTDV